jgi:hypothetical protein
MRPLLVLSLLLACSVQETGAPAPAPQLATPAPTAPPAEEPLATDPDCDMTAAAPPRVRIGEPATMTVSMSASGAYKLNHEAPFSVGVTSDRLRTSKPRYSLDDASVLAPHAVTLEIPFLAHTPGEHALEVHASFGLCSDADCSLCKERRQLTTIVD